ncbi:uncharacterized protein EV422DRAFT_525300 [Fimicolochytrium jonesii]|uniref:uncharacterized protein n=1 Tax=Fimicolochytrium jonesii TaxID=1396493 RepID=UPI0022FE4635|nr:uncharacterized protein EV422DRAFT_525300 [Fimicolochytrium jonesii]KAI8822016.1 hypothetical protein EV422DRAFT_525300 [Fimicolochytrium jonesii]
MAQDRLIRWALSVTSLTQEQQQACLAFTALLPPAEQTRIRKFVHTVDALRSLVGQLLARLAILSFLPAGTRWAEVEIQRNDEWKPYLVSPAVPNLLFNVSHQGDWVVLLAGHAQLLGVDVARTEMTAAQKLSSYFSYFPHVFTDREWEYIRGYRKTDDEEGCAEELPTGAFHVDLAILPESQVQQLHRFHQMWALKESYIKAIGRGLDANLRHIEFSVPEGHVISLDPGHVEREITLSVDGEEKPECLLTLSYLDALHPIATCHVRAATAGPGQPAAPLAGDEDGQWFKERTWAELESSIRKVQ